MKEVESSRQTNEQLRISHSLHKRGAVDIILRKMNPSRRHRISRTRSVRRLLVCPFVRLFVRYHCKNRSRIIMLPFLTNLVFSCPL